MNKLAYWCNANASLMKYVFLHSPYYDQKDDAHKKKCDRKDYLQRTIREALADLRSTAREDHERWRHEQAVAAFTSATPTTEPQATEQSKLQLICMADVESVRTKWLWHPYIPLGKITLLQGDPGTGKTMFSLLIASTISTGGNFFGDDELTRREPGIVVYQTAEDGIADTIKPRLSIMRPNFKNIYLIDETNQGLTLSDGRIEETLKTLRPKLMIIDPLQAYLGAGTDMHRANEVRPILAQIGRLAEQYECAIVFIMHMSKMSQVKALYRGLGSIDIPAAARSLLVIGSNPENPDEKIMAHKKSSLARHGQSIAFHLDSDNGGIVFDGFSQLTANEVLGPPASKSRERPNVEEATALITEMLGEDGYAKLEDIKTAAVMSGISDRTLYRAKQDLKLPHLTLGYGDKRTFWMLPHVEKETVKNNDQQDTVVEFPGKSLAEQTELPPSSPQPPSSPNP